jgi:hypothetical protein
MCTFYPETTMFLMHMRCKDAVHLCETGSYHVYTVPSLTSSASSSRQVRWCVGNLGPLPRCAGHPVSAVFVACKVIHTGILILAQNDIAVFSCFSHQADQGLLPSNAHPNAQYEMKCTSMHESCMGLKIAVQHDFA